MDNALPENLNAEWQKFFDDYGGKVPGGYFVYDCVFDHPLLFPLQRRMEMEAMMEKAAEIEPLVVAELGADKGGSALHWIAAHPSVKKAIIVEIRGVPYADLFRKAFPDVEILAIEASSYSPETIEKVKGFLGDERIDCLFIDSDKCRYDADFNAYLPMMKSGGIVFMHDCNPKCNPKDFPCGVFFRSLAGKYKTELILDESEHATATGKTEHDNWLAEWKNVPTCGVGCVMIP